MIRKLLLCLFCVVLTSLFLLPLLMTLASSFMSADELVVVYGDKVSFRWIPYKVTGEGYFRLLFASEAYLSTFWNSMLIALSSTAAQVFISLIMGYAFAKARVRGKNALFFLYIIIMLMPFQVTLLPNFLLAKELGLYNTWWALILPSAFSPLGVFLMRQFILEVPHDIIEAAHIDTSSNLRVIFGVVAPSVYAGLLAVAVLFFAESWNMVEQPLILLKDEWLYPLSIRLNALAGASMDIRFSGAVLYIIPAVLLYFLFENELTEGIRHMKL